MRTGDRNYGLTVIGRLATDVSLEGAGERMAALGAALDAQYPDWSPGRQLRVVSLSEHIVGRAVPWMRLLIGACVLILVIACVNVTNLLLVRAIERQREFAMRGALGATRVRIVRTMVFEGLVLSLGATALALPVSVVGVDLLRAWLPPELPRLAEVTLDPRVAAIAALTAVIVAVAASVAPALRALRMDLTAPMRASSRSSTAGPIARRARGILIVAQVACAVVLLAGAGLFGQSFWKVMRLELGFEHERLLTLNVNIAVRDGRYEEAYGPAQFCTCSRCSRPWAAPRACRRWLRFLVACR